LLDRGFFLFLGTKRSVVIVGGGYGSFLPTELRRSPRHFLSEHDFQDMEPRRGIERFMVRKPQRHDSITLSGVFRLFPFGVRHAPLACRKLLSIIRNRSRRLEPRRRRFHSISKILIDGSDLLLIITITIQMWACARGHTETAVMLYKWNHTALNMKNTSNQTALECAKTNNHNELVKELEKLELRRDKANMMLHSSNSFSTESPTVISPASSVASLTSIASTSKSHDGVFLRPGAVTRSESQKYKMLNIDLDSDPNIIGSNKMLGSMPSPLLSDSSASTRGSNGQKLIKRPSIDSGIHMSCCSNSENSKSKNSRLFSSPRQSKYSLERDSCLTALTNSILGSTEACRYRYNRPYQLETTPSIAK
jgi:hypothetical protein